ncbi:hypothetical protein AB1Y20_016371 [Prymnesium parvum]|uniref:Uncharacterized protein n=1 Tax=Prymnesium parvum TaxID=97485 RepID=A0AB34IF13_PRYPA
MILPVSARAPLAAASAAAAAWLSLRERQARALAEERAAELQSKAQRLDLEVQSLQRAVARRDEKIGAKEAELWQAEAEARRSAEALAAARAAKTESEEAGRRAAAELARRGEQLAEREEEAVSLRAEVEALRAECAAARREAQEARREVEAVEAALAAARGEAECSVEGQLEAEERATTLQAELKEAREEVAALRSEGEAARVEAAAAAAAMKEMAQRTCERATVDAMIGALEEKLRERRAAAEEKYARMDERYAELRAAHQTAREALEVKHAAGVIYGEKTGAVVALAECEKSLASARSRLLAWDEAKLQQLEQADASPNPLVRFQAWRDRDDLDELKASLAALEKKLPQLTDAAADALARAKAEREDLEAKLAAELSALEAEAPRGEVDAVRENIEVLRSLEREVLVSKGALEPRPADIAHQEAASA